MKTSTLRHSSGRYDYRYKTRLIGQDDDQCLRWHQACQFTLGFFSKKLQSGVRKTLKSDLDRGSRFYRSPQVLGTDEGLIDPDDSPEQASLPSRLLGDAILALSQGIFYDSRVAF